jgi:exosortase A-associated hydrolase 2
MTGSDVEAFRLVADAGARFALFRAPRTSSLRGAILYVPPFAEEMNKSRRMASLQAQAFAATGLGVLQIDLFGCGDSDGELADARWTLWQRDVDAAASWLEARGYGPIHLWGLRLGATLALSSWQQAPSRFASALLWQPVHDGTAFVTQFLRLAVARDALRGAALTTDALRARLASGAAVDVAGYALAPELAHAIEAQRLANFSLAGARVQWLDVRSGAGDTPPAVSSAIASMKAHGVDVQHRAVSGQPFWSTLEIAEVPALIDATTALVGA